MDRFQRLVGQMLELQRIKSVIDEAFPARDYMSDAERNKLYELVDHPTHLDDLLRLLLDDFGAMPNDLEDGKARVRMINDDQHIVDPFDVEALQHWEDFEVSIGTFHHIIARMKYPITHRQEMPALAEFIQRYHHLFGPEKARV